MLTITSVVSSLALTAAAQAEGSVFYAVVYVDLVPSDNAPGSDILAGYVHRVHQDADCRSVTLIAQSSIPNHYILLETFASVEAYQRFTREAYVRDFRTALFPHLGSPWDERLGVTVSP